MVSLDSHFCIPAWENLVEKMVLSEVTFWKFLEGACHQYFKEFIIFVRLIINLRILVLNTDIFTHQRISFSGYCST